MIQPLKSKTCDECGKQFLIVCHCQITPEELEANRQRSLELVADYYKNMERLKVQFPNVNFDTICNG